MKTEWKIAFTQYLRPDGKRRIITITVPRAVAEKAAKMMELGYHLEAEILTTGQVSLSVAGKNCDVAVEVVANDEHVPPAVNKLISMFRFDEAKRKDDRAAKEPLLDNAGETP